MKKQLKIVVLAKQVPDTRNVGKDAMMGIYNYFILYRFWGGYSMYY